MADFEGWSVEELEARLEEIKDEVEEFHELEKTIEFLNEISYLRDEGFIDIEHCEDGEVRLYPKQDAWEPELG